MRGTGEHGRLQRAKDRDGYEWRDEEGCSRCTKTKGRRMRHVGLAAHFGERERARQ